MTRDDSRPTEDRLRGLSRDPQDRVPEGVTPLVSVVVPCFNQAEYLGEALESVLAQTRQDFEIIVVDDGSTDATPDVARRYPRARYLKQANRGLSAARNAGIRASRGRYLVFLDADDRLLPEALEAGLRCFGEQPGCAFVSGGHCNIDEAGSVIARPTPTRVDEDHYLSLLHGNYVGMHAAVMYDRSLLAASGGFDEALSACEDYELYLRLARSHPVQSHETVVAEYRAHGASMSGRVGLMLPAALAVLDSQRPFLEDDPRRARAYRQGLDNWRRFYVEGLLDQLSAAKKLENLPRLLHGIVVIARHAPALLCGRAYHRLVRPVVPTPLLRLAARLRGRSYHPPVGRVRFGDLRRTKPMSEWFGFDRGQPIDRYYIERFLAAHSADIRDRVLEIGDAGYTRKFGARRVTRSDVLNVSQGDPQTTIVADLTAADHVPSDAFDCAIVTQTLHLIYDAHSALETIYRILKPGGVLLATAPGVTQISRDQWAPSWHWSFTARSMRRLLEEIFSSDHVEVEAVGNVLTATAFLQGIAAGELKKTELEFRDSSYELLITARAVKPSTPSDLAAPRLPPA